VPFMKAHWKARGCEIQVTASLMAAKDKKYT
jgi:hypothetical protein